MTNPLPEQFLQDAARRAFSPDKTESPEQFAARLERNFDKLGEFITDLLGYAPSAAILKSLIDAKGDLIAGTAADTPARLAVGANNTVLMADSAQSTGTKWSAEPVRGIAETGLKIIRGTVETTTPTIVVGSGFTIARNGVGDVTVTFSSAFSAAPTVTLGSNRDECFHGAAPTATTCRPNTANTTGAATEGTFQFIAIGPA